MAQKAGTYYEWIPMVLIKKSESFSSALNPQNKAGKIVTELKTGR